MTLKFIPLTYAVLLLTLATYGQTNYCWQWEKKTGNSNIKRVKLISANKSFVYTGGEFTDSALSFDNTTYTNKGGSDIVIVKRDSKGNIIWLQTTGGPGYDQITDMAVDNEGSVYIGGSFTDHIQADNISLPGIGGTDIFIAKYSALGKLAWLKVFGSPDSEYLTRLVIEGTIIRFSGSFTGSSLTLEQFILVSTNGPSFNAALQVSNGNIIYAANFINSFSAPPGTKYQYMDKKGNYYYAGISYDSVTIGTFTIKPTCRTLAWYGKYTSLLWAAKTDSTGKIIWAKDLYPCDTASSLENYREYLDFYVDEPGNIYVSLIIGAWPAIYGPSPGDPYLNMISCLSSDGVIQQSGYLITYGFLGTVVIRRYFVSANNKKVLLKNTTLKQIDYLQNISQQDFTKNRIISGTINFNSAYIDTAHNEFYFTDNSRLSKLGSGMYVNAGANKTICAPYLPIILGDETTASCGTPPYTYRWVPAAALNTDTIANPTVQLNQVNGKQEFVLTVRGSTGETAADTIVITKASPLPKPLITASNNELLATSPVNDSYQWYYYDSLLSNEKGNLIPLIKDGAYQVKITDTNNCSSVSDTFYAYRITIHAGADTSICKGHQVQLGGTPTASAAAGNLTYEWTPSLNLNDASSSNPVAVPAQSVCYKLQVKNSVGNDVLDSVCLTVLPVPAPVISQQGDVLHSNYTTGNKWFLNGQLIAGANEESFTIEEEGDYVVQVTDANGCSANSTPYHATQTELTVKVFPSPVINAMKIQYNLPQANLVSIKIINVSMGSQTILLNNVYGNAGNHTLHLTAAKLSKGVNIVRITIQGQSKSFKFIVL